MKPTIHKGRSVYELFARTHITKCRLEDYLWFRRSVTQDAEPFAIETEDRYDFFWRIQKSDGVVIEPWGGSNFVHRTDLSMSDSQAKRLIEVFEHPFVALCADAHPFFAPQDETEYAATQLDISPAWNSFEDYSYWAWSAKRRKNIRQELGRFDSLTVDIRDRPNWVAFDFLVGLDNAACAKHGDDAPSNRTRMAEANMLSTAWSYDRMRLLTVRDHDRLVAAEYFLEDERSGAIMEYLGHGLSDEYPSIGKFLYSLVIGYAIRRRRKYIDAMPFMNDMKKQFRFQALPTKYIDIGRDRT